MDVDRPPGMSNDAWNSFELNHTCVEASNAKVIVSNNGLRKWMTANIIGLAIVAASACGFVWKAIGWAVLTSEGQHTQTQILATLAAHDQKLETLTTVQAAQGAKIDDIDQALRGKTAP